MDIGLWTRRPSNLLSAMKEHKWKSRTKHDLMIEVWEHLDCETVGARELEEIERAVRERFGDGAVESPVRVARLLADEGAELRHAEVLELDTRTSCRPPLQFVGWRTCADSLRAKKIRWACAWCAKRHSRASSAHR